LVFYLIIFFLFTFFGSGFSFYIYGLLKNKKIEKLKNKFNFPLKNMKNGKVKKERDAECDDDEKINRMFC
jgi:hypothetical protein